MSNETPIQHGEVTATYFWDDGSGINGDTGAPAGGEPMQKGLFSSPSWPLGTEGYIVHEGEQYDFFIGDRGPGVPSHDCDVLLDIDGKTFADMMGESFDEQTLVVSGGNGHAEVEYYITEWGDGHGTEGAPHPFQQPGNKCENAVSPIPEEHLPQEEPEEEEETEETEEETAEEESTEDSGDENSEESGDAEEQEQQDEASATEEQEDSDTGVTAETAANDLSGFGLMGAEGTPSAAGLLTLAIIPAILIALFFAWTRRPAGAHAGADDDSGKGLMTAGTGRHGISSLIDRLRRR
ncbi:hypothetical protein GCM10007079_34630 [Nocardiopsis terrae]|uniref:Uncharacterized protein n=1 Tax=Nocardiopsis terrae TaxID=372655 RepID=A0ABR9HJU2_9ACTN|nr:hypothetical protein [Nocardiopsis terrae]MBE1459276.1 hypothetical protein [Nocardiopsis terrae]GHC89061.1 hypothetical protein GCM10007079_34630 [Nocardiopsis terrae]